MIALEQEAYAIAGQPFNMASPKQIGEILFNRLGLPVKKKTATGARRPTRRCCRSWPPTTRCRPSCWSTAAWPSSRAPTPTSCPA
jgi:DNA polymerase-1